MKTTIKIPMFSAALAVGLAAGSASSAEKAYSGALCQPLFGPATYVPDGSIANETSQDIAVLCPVTRNDLTTGSNMVTNATVWVVNSGPAADSIQCVLHAEDNDSGAFAFESRASALISGEPQRLLFDSFGAPGGQGWSLNVTCLLPRQLQPGAPSTIKNLRIKES